MPKPYEGAKDETCPLRAGKLCWRVCPTCKFQEKFVTRTAQGDVNVRYDCALFMQHVLQVEGNQFAFEHTASIDAFRNEVVTQNRQALGGAVKLAERALDSVEITVIEAPK